MGPCLGQLMTPLYLTIENERGAAAVLLRRGGSGVGDLKSLGVFLRAGMRRRFGFPHGRHLCLQLPHIICLRSLALWMQSRFRKDLSGRP